MDSVKKYLREYSFIFLWILGGAVHKYVGAVIVLASFLLLFKKKHYDRVLVSFWVLLTFSDSVIPVFGFATLIKPVIALLLGGVSFLQVLNGKVRNQFIVPFIPFFVYVLISSIYHPDFLNSIETGTSYVFIYLIPGTFFILIKRQNKTEDFFRSIIISGNLILITSIVLGVLFPSIGSNVAGRLNGIFRNPNGVGIFLVVYSILSYILFNKLEFSKRTKQVTYLLIVVSLFYSGARSSLGAVIIFFVGVSLANKSPWIFVLFTTIFFYLFHTVYDLVILALIQAGYSDTFRLKTLQAASGRIYVWQAAWEVIHDSFFFGRGFNYSEKLAWLREHYDTIPMLKAHDGNAHQSFLSLWMNNGLIGLFLWSVAWLRVILISLKKSQYTLPLVAAIAFSASYESWLVASLNPFTIQLILVFALFFYCDKSANIEKDNQKAELITK